MTRDLAYVTANSVNQVEGLNHREANETTETIRA